MEKKIFLILIFLLRIRNCRLDNFGTKTLLLLLKGFSDKGLEVYVHTQTGQLVGLFIMMCYWWCGIGILWFCLFKVKWVMPRAAWLTYWRIGRDTLVKKDGIKVWKMNSLCVMWCNRK